MARVQLPSEGCRGVDGPRGEIYRPAKGKSYVDIPDGSFARQAAAALGTAPSAMFRAATADSKECPTCGFERWAWVEKCPRCRRA